MLSVCFVSVQSMMVRLWTTCFSLLHNFSSNY